MNSESYSESKLRTRDGSRFQLSPDDHRRREWRRPGQRSYPVFPIARHTGPQLWSGVPFLLTAGPLWSSLEVHLQPKGSVDDFLRTVKLPFLLQYLDLIFLQIRSYNM
ncbi:hypothetical protein TNCV_3763771 [Trichonephila clavipes]|uniref:Uncharacterized protein n=1 Tax=Trichonephila clavipes TaxID=2585209 RepID=A0A8X6VV78_TRICX|nr:hypothetical protein TNCV_3763771 [Trichonephila clavipes]